MAWKIALILSLAIAAIFVLAAGRPTTFQVQRSIIIQASPQKIFALLDDFHNWSRWAPQDKEDPTMRRTFSGAASGPGAISEWTSSGSAGTGRMTITQSTAQNNFRSGGFR
jgi:hypothetical protein